MFFRVVLNFVLERGAFAFPSLSFHLVKWLLKMTEFSAKSFVAALTETWSSFVKLFVVICCLWSFEPTVVVAASVRCCVGKSFVRKICFISFIRMSHFGSLWFLVYFMGLLTWMGWRALNLLIYSCHLIVIFLHVDSCWQSWRTLHWAFLLNMDVEEIGNWGSDVSSECAINV